MPDKNPIRKALKVANKKDYARLLELIMPTPLQYDIIRLRWMGFHPDDFPSLSSKYRKGERLSVIQVAQALNISRETVMDHSKQILRRIERTDFLEWFNKSGP